MITVSDELAETLAGYSYQIHWRIHSWLDEEVIAEDIPAFDVVEEGDVSLRVPERLTFRVPLEADGVSWVPMNVDHPLAVYGQRILAQVGVSVGFGAVEWLNRGIFLLNSVETDEFAVTVECLGLLQLLDEAVLASEYQPTTGATLKSALRELVEPGITVDFDEAPTDRSIKPSAVTWSDNRLDDVYTILDAWPAQGRITHEGHLEITEVPEDPQTESPSLVAFYDSGDWATAQTGPFTYTLADVTVQIDDLILVFSSHGSGSCNVATPTGGDLDYTLRQKPNANDDGSHSDSWLWTATATSDATFDLSAVYETAVSSAGGLIAYVWRNAALGATSGDEDADTGGGPSLSLTTSQANSAVVFFASDWNFEDGANRAWRAIGNVTEKHYVMESPHQTTYSAYSSNIGTAGPQIVGLTAPTGQVSNSIAVEVVPSVFSFTDGVGGTVMEFGANLSREGAFNTVIAEGQYADDRGALAGLPIIHTAVDVDVDSPFSFFGNFSPFMVPHQFSSPLLNEHTETLLAARAKLRELRQRASRTIEISCVPNPALMLGDPVLITSSRLALTGQPARVVSFRLPYSADGGPMTVAVALPGVF